MAHTIYKTADGTRVPGVTTILGVLNKPALVPWANKMGLQGIDTTRYVDELADAGTLAHAMVLDYLSRKEEVWDGHFETDLSHYSEYQIELASNSFQSFYNWVMQHTIEPVVVEQPLVSELYKFGGTPDLLANIDGVSTLVDFKTGKAIYPEHYHQVAAYQKLLEEHEFYSDEVMILRIGRTDDEGFEIKPVTSIEKHWQMFVHCHAIYELQKQLRKGE